MSGLADVKRRFRQLSHEAELELARARKAIFSARSAEAWREARAHLDKALKLTDQAYEVARSMVGAFERYEEATT